MNKIYILLTCLVLFACNTQTPKTEAATETPTATIVPETKVIETEGGSLVCKLQEGGLFINDTRIGFTPSIDDLSKLFGKEARVVPSDDPKKYKAQGLTAQDLYVFDDLGITCMVINGTKKCNGISFIMQYTAGHNLFPSKQFNESIGRLQFGPYAISKDFDHKNLQNSADFTLVNSSEREFYYKCYGTDIYFKYDLFAKGELFKAFISLEKSRF